MDPKNNSINVASGGVDWRVRHRKRISLFVLGCCVTDIGLLWAFALLGTISGDLVVWYAVIALGATGVCHFAIRSGYSERFVDPQLTAFQVGVASALQLGGLILAPQIGLIFLNNQFVIFTLGTFRLRVLTTMIASVVLLSICGVLLVWAHGLGDSVTTGRTELILFWLSYVMTLGRSNLVAWIGSAARRRLVSSNRELAQNVARATERANHDPLTKLINRATLLGLLESESADARDGRTCVAMLDLDHFKAVNDRYGHLVGDRVLERFARVARSCLREGDLIGRYGGEEFVIVFRKAGGDQAKKGLDRLLAEVEELNWQDIAPALRLTVSAGFTESRPGDSAASLLHRADLAMYCAKQRGRNAVVQFDGSIEEPLSTAS